MAALRRMGLTRPSHYSSVASRHNVSPNPLPAYLDETTFRFSNRENPYLFRDTLMKPIEAPVLEYRKLTAA
jgi:hypothetical protein